MPLKPSSLLFNAADIEALDDRVLWDSEHQPERQDDDDGDDGDGDDEQINSEVPTTLTPDGASLPVAASCTTSPKLPTSASSSTSPLPASSCTVHAIGACTCTTTTNQTSPSEPNTLSTTRGWFFPERELANAIPFLPPPIAVESASTSRAPLYVTAFCTNLHSKTASSIMQRFTDCVCRRVQLGQ
jgi:hypothetical protein